MKQDSVAPHCCKQHFFKDGFCPTMLELPGLLVRNADLGRLLQTPWFRISEREAQECAFYQSAQGILIYIKVLEVFHRKIKISLNGILDSAVPFYLSCLILWHVPLRALCSNKSKICTCQKYWITWSSPDTAALLYPIAFVHILFVPCF